MIKKITALLLSLFIVLGSFSGILGLVVLASTNELRIQVANDLHFKPKSDIGRVNNGQTVEGYPQYAYVMKNGLLFSESEAIIKSMLDSFVSSDAEFLLIPGDLVDDGMRHGHQKMVQMLSETERSGKQIFVINGNHDLLCEISKPDFAELYKDFGYSQALSRHDGSLSYTAELDGDYRLLAIDPSDDNGVWSASESLLLWIKQQADTAKEEGKHLIAIMHYGLLNHMKGIASYAIEMITDNRIVNADDVYGLFADWGIKYIFTGHAHSTDITREVSTNGNEIYDIETGSLIGYPCLYRSVTFSDSEVILKEENVTSISTDYLPTGYTNEQLNAISDDLIKYAYGYIAPSAKYTLRELLINTWDLTGRLGVENDSELGKIIFKIAPVMYELLDMPIQKSESTNGKSFEEYAAQYGVDLGDSEYNNLYDAIANILSVHMAGDENIPANSPEIKLLWCCAKIAMLSVFDGMEEDINAALAECKLPFDYTNLKICASKLMFRETLSRELLMAFIYPLIEGVTMDAYAPADRNATLTPYTAQAEKQNPWQWINDVSDYFKRVFEIIIEIISGRFYDVIKK